ncbi:hypothetical protein GCM10022225_47910 [Plantactinospora mayteni]|uniref:PE domain-containing protein n=1 Tax=Plantactinospora mayteni TaxID=566021 RepID=A0ABQ4ESS1_9ACTN|nr:hypothetical protein [Plantactinospora mayteni]GIG97698.1 hypothetical protein Pma05_42710 [Plantactinospora mayteni]
MAVEDERLGANLAELWLCGRLHFPEMAEIVAGANRLVAGTGGDSSAFERHGAIPNAPGMSGTVTGQVFPVWDELRDTFQQVLARTAERLYDNGDALVEVADGYAAADENAAARSRYVQDREMYREEYPIPDSEDRPAIREPNREFDGELE